MFVDVAFRHRTPIVGIVRTLGDVGTATVLRSCYLSVTCRFDVDVDVNVNVDVVDRKFVRSQIGTSIELVLTRLENLEPISGNMDDSWRGSPT